MRKGCREQGNCSLGRRASLEPVRGEVVSSRRCLADRPEQSAGSALGKAVPAEAPLARLAVLKAKQSLFA